MHFPSHDLYLNMFWLTVIKYRLSISGESRREHWKDITDTEGYIREPLEI